MTVVVGVDQGTTNTKAVAVDAAGRVLHRAARPIATHAPQPGWVEQDPMLMLANVVECVREHQALHFGIGARAALIGREPGPPDFDAFVRRADVEIGRDAHTAIVSLRHNTKRHDRGIIDQHRKELLRAVHRPRHGIARKILKRLRRNRRVEQLLGMVKRQRLEAHCGAVENSRV